jgi:hypothetical protein
MDLISNLASALPPPSRGAFLQLIANNLATYPQEMRGLGGYESGTPLPITSATWNN